MDSIFEDTAMDVSSDISVLHTVLAQEGLTEDEFTKMQKRCTVIIWQVVSDQEFWHVFCRKSEIYKAFKK